MARREPTSTRRPSSRPGRQPSTRSTPTATPTRRPARGPASARSSSRPATRAGSDELKAALEVAQRLGAEPLRAEIRLGGGVRSTPKAASRQGESLTTREAEILALVALGRSNRQIGTQLFISAKTASVHVSNIIAKLGVTGRGEAAVAGGPLSRGTLLESEPRPAAGPDVPAG